MIDACRRKLEDAVTEAVRGLPTPSLPDAIDAVHQQMIAQWHNFTTEVRKRAPTTVEYATADILDTLTKRFTDHKAENARSTINVLTAAIAELKVKLREQLDVVVVPCDPVQGEQHTAPTVDAWKLEKQPWVEIDSSVREEVQKLLTTAVTGELATFYDKNKQALRAFLHKHVNEISDKLAAELAGFKYPVSPQKIVDASAAAKA